MEYTSIYQDEEVFDFYRFVDQHYLDFKQLPKIHILGIFNKGSFYEENSAKSKRIERVKFWFDNAVKVTGKTVELVGKFKSQSNKNSVRLI